MIRRFLPLILVGLVVTACTPSNNFSSDGTGTSSGTTTGLTTGGSTGSVSVGSCAELSAYTSLTACKQATYAQCYPSTKIINGQTGVCYFPVAGWESCANNQAQWSYGSWGSYCKESTGVYKRTRTATCQRSVAACDCITDSVTEGRCMYGVNIPGNPSYPYCSQSDVSGAVSCNATPTPVPTATPTATPSWCNRTFLNWEVGGNNSTSVLVDVNASRYSNIISFFSGKGYALTNTRSSSYQLSAIGAITATDRANAYVVQIEGSSSGCWLGKKVSVTVRLYKGGVELTNGSETTACVSFGNETGRALDRALSRMNVPYCN